MLDVQVRREGMRTMRRAHGMQFDLGDDGWVDHVLTGNEKPKLGDPAVRLDGPLPPLTEEEKKDPLLQPMEMIPAEYWGDDGWTVVTDTGESFDHHSVHGVIKWLGMEGRLQSVQRFIVLRHRKGDQK